MQLFHPDNALWQGINKVLLILYAGILWFLCSLPVITMGAASSALLEVMMKLVRNQEGYIGPFLFRRFPPEPCARESRAGSRSLPHCSFFLSIHFTISLPARPSVFRRFFFSFFCSFPWAQPSGSSA